MTSRGFFLIYLFRRLEGQRGEGRGGKDTEEDIMVSGRAEKSLREKEDVQNGDKMRFATAKNGNTLAGTRAKEFWPRYLMPLFLLWNKRHFWTLRSVSNSFLSEDAIWPPVFLIGILLRSVG